MTFVITHRKVSAKLDVADTTLVRPQAWNDAHKMTVSAGVVGRKSGIGDGEPEMLPMYVDEFGNIVTLAMQGALTLPKGTVAQRPATPVDGMVRYNTDSGRVEAYQSGAWVTLVVVPDAVVPTGTYIYTFAPDAMPGWIVAYGNIGSATSGAGNRANLDTLPLYKMLWEGYPDTFATVTGGRGAVAEEDFHANKVMAVPDLRETVLAASGDLGGSVTSNLRLKTGKLPGFVDTVTKGTRAGSKEHLMVTTEMPAHTHDIDFTKLLQQNLGGTGSGTQVWSDTAARQITQSTGGGIAHNNVQPTVLLNALIKL